MREVHDRTNTGRRPVRPLPQPPPSLVGRRDSSFTFEPSRVGRVHTPTDDRTSQGTIVLRPSDARPTYTPGLKNPVYVTFFAPCLVNFHDVPLSRRWSLLPDLFPLPRDDNYLTDGTRFMKCRLYIGKVIMNI